MNKLAISHHFLYAAVILTRTALSNPASQSSIISQVAKLFYLLQHASIYS